MSIQNRIAAAAAILTLAGASAQADTGSARASTTIRLRAFVPVICHVELPAGPSMPDADGIAHLGMAQEFCNAPQGYRVVVNHPLDLEGAALISDGRRIPLSPTGQTVLTDSYHPDIRRVAVAVDLGDEPARFTSLGLRIEAKG